MKKLLEMVAFVSANHDVILSGIGIILVGVISILTGIMAVMMVVPGEQPQKQLQGAIDFLQKIVDMISKVSVSKKPEAK